MSCPEQLHTQSLLDGELGGAAATSAKRHMESCGECQSLHVQDIAVGDLVRRHAVRYRAPERTVARVRAALDSEAGAVPRQFVDRRSFWLGALGGAAISAFAASLASLVLFPASGASVLEMVTDAHTRAMMSGHAVEVVSSNRHTVKPWFAGRVPIAPPVADFALQGFSLAGGRTDKVAGARAAVLVYRHSKHEIDVFVWADNGSHLPAAGVRHGYHVEFWKRGDLDFAAVSDMDSTEMKKFAQLVRGEQE
ncbi:MAG TPA: anti-sigma factor [Rhizomicrobium sp.]